MVAQRISEVYERLYHYTTFQGALGILKDRQIWATHCRFLNDYSEIGYFNNWLVDFLKPYVLEEFGTLDLEAPHIRELLTQNGGLNAVATHDTQAVVSTLYGSTKDEIYVTSFCGEHKDDAYINRHGLLSQWRGYGGDGGVALVFRSDTLKSLLEKEFNSFDYSPILIVDIIYAGEEARFAEELDADLSKIAKYVRLLFQDMKDPKSLCRFGIVLAT